MNILDTIEKTNGGQYFAVIGHESKTDKSIKNRLLQAATGAIPRKVDQDAQRLETQTALTAAHLLAPYGIPADLASEALIVLVDRVKARKSGKSQGGATGRESLPERRPSYSTIATQSCKIRMRAPGRSRCCRSQSAKRS